MAGIGRDQRRLKEMSGRLEILGPGWGRERLKIHGLCTATSMAKTPSSRRTIPIPEDAMIELRRHKARQNQERLALGSAYEDNGLVFCTEDGKPLEPRNITRHFDLLLKRAGLSHIRFHDARHTFATLMLELGNILRPCSRCWGTVGSP